MRFDAIGAALLEGDITAALAVWWVSTRFLAAIVPFMVVAQ